MKTEKPATPSAAKTPTTANRAANDTPYRPLALKAVVAAALMLKPKTLKPAR